MDRPPHTPTPWHVNNALLSIYGPANDGSDRLVLDMPVGSYENGSKVPKSVQSQEDAAFIIKAVNAHYELVAALRGMVEAAEVGKVFTSGSRSTQCCCGRRRF